MKRLLFLICFAVNTLMGQDITMERNIEWEETGINYAEGQKIETLYFKGVDYLFEKENVLPVYTLQLEVPAGKKVDKINLWKEKFKPVNSQEKEIIQNWDNIFNDISIEHHISGARDKNILSISFVPVFKSNNEYNKLEAFKIGIWLNDGPIIKSRFKSKSNSVLSTGEWIKIKIRETGIYRITYNELAEMGLENLQNISLYGNSTGMLPEMNNVYRPDDLTENAIHIERGSNDVFDQGDYILFYAKSPNLWKYNTETEVFIYDKHLYSNYAYYYLTTDHGPGKTLANVSSLSENPDLSINTFNDYAVHELEDTNLLRSGKQWSGEHFYNLLEYDFNFSFQNRVTSQPVKLFYNMVARSSDEYDLSSFDIYANSSHIENVIIDDVNFGSYVGQFAHQKSAVKEFNASGNTINIALSFNPSGSTSEGWLDFLNLNVIRELNFNGDQLLFRNISSVDSGNISQFTIANVNSNLKIWDVTDAQNASNIIPAFTGQTASFVINTDTLKEFVAFDGSSYLSITDYQSIENQNLHGEEVCDMIIVVKPQFMEHAKWIADFHEEQDNLLSFIVTPDEIYNEYSSGMADVAAIRDFARHMFEKSIAGNNKFKYLLLFGDGSFDNRESSISSTNYLLTYQSNNSLHNSSSFVTDDFFGLLNENEGANSGFLDIGIGRIPVLKENDANTVLNKIENYYSSNSFGDWRNWLCFIADDADENQPFHMSDANDYADYIEENYPVFSIDKIFLDAFPQESTPGGQRYPNVNQAINDRVRKGALIINYTGHGNPKVLTDEQVVTVSEINSWDNFDKLAVFVTATCEFSRYDDKNRISAGEYIMNNPNGGALAMLTTSRLVYAGSNDQLNTEFYKHAFDKVGTGEYHRLGDMVRLTKSNTGTANSTNKRNFSLLGDPALKLAIPALIVATDSINGIEVEYIGDVLVSELDTLKALSKVRVCGHIQDAEGNFMNSIDGVLYPTIFDKYKIITTLSNDGYSPLTYVIQKNIIYKGKASISNGRFEFSFIVPRDITYSFGPGKISYYMANNDIDGRGYFNDAVIGGSSDDIVEDDFGPQIELFLNSEDFIFGGTTNENPKILAIINDSSGINTVGNGIGHDITAILDDNTNNIIVLNDYYEADLDSYQSGKIEYVITNLSEGNHNLKLKVWDIYNNPNEEYIEFVVSDSEELALKNIFNYPNPFTTQTAFYFDHNQPNTDLEIMIQVFTVSGKLIKTLEQIVNTTGFRNEPILWDGLDDYGDRIGRGVYIYRIKVRTPDGAQIEKFEKLVILK